MSVLKVHNLIMVVSICCAHTSLQAVDRNVSSMLKAAVALAALGTAGKLALTHPESPAAACAAGALAGSVAAAGTHYIGRYTGVIWDDRTSRRFIHATGALGVGTGIALRNYIPNTTAVGAGYVVACGAMATLSCRRLDDLVDF